MVSYHDLALRDFAVRPYIVATQHDAPRPEICDRNVVQNSLNLESKTDHFIPHWPQPGLLPRDPARGARIETLSFKGSMYNLYQGFRTPAFLAELRAEGLTLEYDVKENATPGDPIHWHDYRNRTCCGGARRDVGTKLKPASKW